MTQTYKITFSGIILFGYDEDQTKADIQKLLKLNPAQMEYFFSGNLVVIKKNLPLDDAQRIVSALESKGLLINLVEEGRIVAEKKVELSLARAPAPSLPPVVGTQSIEPVRHTNFSERASRKSASSYYEPPKSSLVSKRDLVWSGNAEEAPDFFKFSLEGRYGRLNYLNMSWAIYGLLLLMMIVGGILSAMLGSGGIIFIAIIIGLLFAFFSVRATVLRLHDLNKSGWLSLILFAGIIPLIGGLILFGFTIYLMCAQGTAGSNEYGAQSKKGNIVGLVLTCLSPVFIGILVGLSLPAYQDYTTRTYVAEGIALASAPKMAVTDYYSAQKSWPSSNEAVGLPDGSRIIGQGVESINVTYGGKIIIQYNQKIDRSTLILEPVVNGGQVDWRCYGGTVKSKNRPKSCRR